MMTLTFVSVFMVVPFALADRVVLTTVGPIQGITVSSDETQIEAFLGVPYAEPPIDRLRFKKPVPKTPFRGVYDASHQPPSCMQNKTNTYFEPQHDNMTEDCLFLNLWVPYSKKTDGLKTVMMFIHGGGFQVGSSNMDVYNGCNLAKSGDVIVVNINYRLGTFGFFFADHVDADGNMGLYDQAMALQWVRDNAKAFGGDPDSIVLMGESAGGISSGMLIASPLTSPMVKRVILQSGSPTIPIGLDGNDDLFNRSQQLAAMLGCADRQFTLKTNARAVIQCLKRLPARDLTVAEGVMRGLNPATFYPRTGDNLHTEHTMKMLQRGDVKASEILIGSNEEEGDIFLPLTAPEYFGHYGHNRVENIPKRLAYQLVAFAFKSAGQKKSKEIADFYINGIKNVTADSIITAMSRSLGDFGINCASYFHSEFQSFKSPVYYYLFTRRPSSTVLADWIKTTHFDEIQYVFGNPLFSNFTSEELELSKKMMARWIAFAKTGNPNIAGRLHWPQFTAKDPEYLRIDDEESVHLRPDNYRCEFWRNRYQAALGDEISARIIGVSSAAIALAAELLITISVALFGTNLLSI